MHGIPNLLLHYIFGIFSYIIYLIYKRKKTDNLVLSR